MGVVCGTCVLMDVCADGCGVWDMCADGYLRMPRHAAMSYEVGYEEDCAGI